jgi:hypothetical protein
MSAMAKAQKIKAEEYLAQATATLNKKSWFGSSKERNQEDAAEFYSQAANAYKVGGLLQEAGDTYVKVGAIFRDALKTPHEAAKAYSSAGTYCIVRLWVCIYICFIYCYLWLTDP